eukprot:1156657-Pelagomonas_calceolata.AAC.3
MKKKDTHWHEEPWVSLTTSSKILQEPQSREEREENAAQATHCNKIDKIVLVSMKWSETTLWFITYRFSATYLGENLAQGEPQKGNFCRGG